MKNFSIADKRFITIALGVCAFGISLILAGSIK